MTHGTLTYRLTESARTDSRPEGKGREGKGSAGFSLHASSPTEREIPPIGSSTRPSSSSMHARWRGRCPR